MGEIVPAQHPVVLRGLAADWPAVRAAATDAGLAGYVRRFDRGAPVEAMVGAPEIRGHFFYDDTARRLNFERHRVTLVQVLKGLLDLADDPAAPCVYVGSTPIPPVLPGFERENAPDLLGPEVMPRLWLGNATTVQTHHDLSDNLACVVGGRRRFTLFPPDQVANLYIGPLDFTPAGRPISMVSLEAPDLERYPRFAQALAFALVAELEPGDAIFIPALWWHHVQALGALNLLVNYWWSRADALAGSPFDAFVHALKNVRHLPPPQREAWRALFEHYVFEADGDPAAHLPVEARGVLGALDEKTAGEMRSFLRKGLAG
ncbi:MAG: cupin-like domain-containing protein [Caulobacter sp.]|nr:cupin-like domain-containing protein [Caulobacter sp.]